MPGFVAGRARRPATAADPFEKLRLDEAEALLAAAETSALWLDKNAKPISPEVLLDFVDTYMYNTAEDEHDELEHIRNLGRRVAYTPPPISHLNFFRRRPYRYGEGQGER